jgi:Plasmid pRiA4b ORF-3-like protein
LSISVIRYRPVTLEQLAAAIDDAFARWDRNHLHEFTLADGTIITPHRWWDGEEPDGSLDGAKIRLRRLRLSEQFGYVFDLGDNWQHLYTVGPKLADPVETLGIDPDRRCHAGAGATSPTSTAAAGTRRRQYPDAARTRRNGRSPADSALVGTAAVASTPGHLALRRGHRDPLPRPHYVTRT